MGKPAVIHIRMLYKSKFNFSGERFMTRQFFAYLFESVFVAVFDQVDIAFGNGINIDSIVALSTFTVITWVIHHLAQIGTYTYRMWQKRLWTCQLVSSVASVITSVIVFFCSDYIVRIWHLTEPQYALCAACLRVYAIGLPFIQFGDFLDVYLLFQSKVKTLMTGNILFYLCLVLTDLWCVKTGKSLHWLILCTVASYILYDIYLFFFSGVRYEKEAPAVEYIKPCIRHGSNILFDKLAGKVATIYYGIMASGMGTMSYAVHSVCYAVCVFGESYTNSFNTFQIVQQKQAREERRYFLKSALLKRYGWRLTLLYAAAIPVITWVIKGDIAFGLVIGWVWVYCSDHFSLLFYESNKAYLEVQEASKYLKYGGLIGGAIRILFVFICMPFHLGLFPFAVACTVDFGARALYYGLCARHVHKKCASCKSGRGL